MESSSISSLFFIFLLLTPHLTSSKKRKEPPHTIEQDREALKFFMKTVGQRPKINWGTENDTCKWTGVICDPTNKQAVIFLRLPAKGLKGQIPSGSLGNITTLKILSLPTNLLSGPLPDDFANLTRLRNVFLFNNSFSGPFPSSVSKWTNLLQLDISGNKFTGGIPYDINNLKQLEKLKLDNNKFDGWLPKLPSSINTDIVNFSVSNNNFEGEIPKSLIRFPKEAFTGNVKLCGKPLPPCNGSMTPPPSPSPGPSESLKSAPKKKKKLSTGAIVAIAVGSPLMLLILLSCLRKKGSRAVKEKKAPRVATTAAADVPAARAGRGFWDGGEAGTSSSKDDVTGASMEGEGNKLVFFEGGVYSFGLEELLRASAEFLGKGSVGKSYKLVLNEGITVVGKRFKDIDVSKKEFVDVMERLGKMKNENVVSIQAYYYSEDDKLLVCDYFLAGSLSARLHGNRVSGRSPLDWDHRLRIALSAAKGVAYLHVAGKVVHGNIKSSNILLRQDSNKDASVSDFGLNTLFGGSSSPNTHVTGYRAPEVLETRKVTFKSDVYSFGVLLLELLTGKAPNPASLGVEGIDLPRWVKSVKQEKWAAEVFDVDLMRYQNIKEELDQLLQIAIACVSTVPDQRPTMQEVVRMIEDMTRVETDDRMRQSLDGPSKGSDGHTLPTDLRNSPNTSHRKPEYST